MSSKRIYDTLCWAVLLMVLTVWAPAASAQDEGKQETEQAQTEEAKPAEPDEPTVIPAADVVSYASGTTGRVNAILESSSSAELISQVEADLPFVIADVDSLVALGASVAPEDVSMRDLEVHRQDWVRQKAKLEHWAERVDEQSQVLQANIEEIDGLSAVWKKTWADTTTKNLPEAVAQQIDSVLTGIQSASTSVRKDMEAVLTLQARISSQAGRTTENIQRIDDEIAARRGKLFGFEERPLWHPIERPAGMSALDEMRRSWATTVHSIETFWEDYQQRILIHVVFVVLMTLILLVVRVRSRRWETEDDAVQLARNVFSRPLSAALVLCLLPLSRIYPNGPVVVYEVAELVVLPALALLLPRVVPKQVMLPLYGILVLFVLNQMHMLVGTSFYRYSYFLLMAGFIAVAWWLYHELGKLAQGRWIRFLRAVVRIAALIAVIALGANILGAVSLADVLVVGVLSSVYLAILAFVAVRVLDGLVVLFLHSRWAQSMRMVVRHRNLLQRRTVGTVHFLIVVAWIIGTLRQFQVLDPIVGWWWAMVDQTWSIGSFSISVGSGVLFVVTLWASTQISRFVRFVLQEDILTRTKLPRGVPSTVSMLVNYAIISIGFLIALAAAGIKLSQFSILIGALGVGIGFGLQTLVNNFVSGLILMFERPIQVGDTIEVGTLLGSVRRIGIRASVVRTFDGAEVIVPNGDLLSGQVVNWTLSDFLRRIEIKAGVAYGTDPDRVIDILLRESNAHEKAIKSPEPYALFLGFGDSSLDFLVRFWTGDSENWLITKSDVTVAINRALVDAGIEIPFPQRDLHVRSVDASVKGLPGVDGETTDTREVREAAGQPEFRQKPIRRSMRTGGDIEGADDGD